MNKFIGFDLEVSNWVPDWCPKCKHEFTLLDDEGKIIQGDQKTCPKCEYSGMYYNFMNPRPAGEYLPGISCAAASYREEPDGPIVRRLWQHPDRLSPGSVMDMTYWLRDMQRRKEYSIVTVNGGFDFSTMYHESEKIPSILDVYLSHIDLMMLSVCNQGFRIGLDAMSEAMLGRTKLHEVTLKDGSQFTEMSGALAPWLWKKGEHQAVIDYLYIDTDNTLEIAETADKQGLLSWITRKGARKSFRFDGPLDQWTMAYCIIHPYRGNTSWMSNYQSPKQFAAWALDEIEKHGETLDC